MAQNAAQKKYHSRFSLDMEDHLRDLVKQRSFDEGLCANALIKKALTKDIEDESLLIAKLTELQRQFSPHLFSSISNLFQNSMP